MSIDDEALLDSPVTTVEEVTESTPRKLINSLNEKIEVFSKFYTSLYSNCSNQRDKALEALSSGNTQLAFTLLRDFPEPIGAPLTPQGVLQQKKKEEDIDLILAQLRGSICEIPSQPSTTSLNLPTPDKNISLEQCKNAFKACDEFITINQKANLQFIFLYGNWLQVTYKLTKSSTTSFVTWINQHSNLKKTQAYRYREFYNNFKNYKRVLNSALPFRWFTKHGTTLARHIRISRVARDEWTA